MAELEITELLKIDPHSSMRKIRRAYKKYRKDMDLNSVQLAHLDLAYEQALRWFEEHPGSSSYEDRPGGTGAAFPAASQSSLFTAAEQEAMRLLGAVPGCNLKAARRAGKRCLIPEKKLDDAIALLSPMSSPPTFGAVMKEVLWKLLTLVPLFLAIPLYSILVRGNTLNFFPKADPALGAWYSGTLVASCTVALLFTLVTSVLLAVSWRRFTAGSRKCRRLNITPSSFSVGHSLSALIDLILLAVVLFFSLNSAFPFYQNAAAYLRDYDRMQGGKFISAVFTDPKPIFDWNPDNDYGFRMNAGDGLVLDSKGPFYLGEDLDSVYETGGLAHQIWARYLPNTGLVEESRVLSYRLYDQAFYNEAPVLQSSYQLEKTVALYPDGRVRVFDGFYYMPEEFDTADSCAEFDLAEQLALPELALRDRVYMLLDQKNRTAKILCSGSAEGQERLVLGCVLDLNSGTVVHGEVLAGWDAPELYLTNDGSFVFVAFRPLSADLEPYSESALDGGAQEVSGFQLHRDTMKLLGQTPSPIPIGSFKDYTVGQLSRLEIFITFDFRRNNRTEEIFIPIEGVKEPQPVE